MSFKEMAIPPLVLMIISIVAAISLAYVNNITESKILVQRDLAVQNSLKEIIPQADQFKELNGIFTAYKNGIQIGVVKKTTTRGYSSNIVMLIGVVDNKITGVKIMSQSETPGLGTNTANPEYLKQYIGKTLQEAKLKKDGGKIDAITGATISSRAVANAVSKS
jgi:Na+-translocating ferredoxin:NAD+ oxidoreductase subunit G